MKPQCLALWVLLVWRLLQSLFHLLSACLINSGFLAVSVDFVANAAGFLGSRFIGGYFACPDRFSQLNYSALRVLLVRFLVLFDNIYTLDSNLVIAWVGGYNLAGFTLVFA